MSLLASAPFRFLSPVDSVRLALMQSLYRCHRPELADMVESAELLLDLPGIWLRSDDSFTEFGAERMECILLEASTEAGLPLSWIRFLGHSHPARFDSAVA